MTSVFVDIPVHDLAIGLAEAPQEVVMAAILTMDDLQSDTSFTMGLIEALVGDLSHDLTKKEMKAFIKTLRDK